MTLFREDSADSLLQVGARSEYTKKYPVHPIERRKPFKPPQEIQMADVPLESVTSQRRDFPEHAVEKRASFRPSQNHEDLAPFEGQTTNKDAFTTWQLPEKHIRAKENWNPPTEPIQTITSQMKDFPEHPVDKRASFRPGQTQVKLAPFDGQTTNKDTFTEKQLPERRVRARENWIPPTEPIQTVTSQKHDYPEHHRQRPQQSYRPDRQLPTNAEKFADSTGYAETFTAHTVQPRAQRPRATWEAPTEAMSLSTTAMRDFQGVGAPPRPSMRPANSAPTGSGPPLESETTNSTSYTNHEAQPRRQYTKRQDNYERPEGGMETMTTNKANYTEHALAKPKVFRPSSSQIMAGRGEMSKDTTTNSHFTTPPTMQRELVRRKDEYVPPSVPMASGTTAALTYQQHDVTPRKNFKPEGSYLKSEEPFQSSTENKDLFTQKPLPPRYVHQKEQHKPPSAGFDDRTTTNQTYVPAEGSQRRAAFRPDQTHVVSDLPFQGSTTTGESFPPHQAAARPRRAAAGYVQPEGHMDLSTTTSLAYQTTGDLPPPAPRPRARQLGDSSLLANAGRFQGSTSYTSDFVAKDFSGRKLMRADNSYQAPSAPFDDATTYKNSMTAHSVARERSRRPDGLTDVLGQRDPVNRYHIRGHDWRGDLQPEVTQVN